MKKNLKSVYFFGIIFLIVDQALKILVEQKMILNQTIVVIKNFFSITLVHNLGAAFSILMGNRIFLILVGIIALILISLYIRKIEEFNDYDVFTYSLLLGGILGNLLDRIIHGYVIDYLNFNIFSYNFPIFNFADVCIVVSVILIFIKAIREDVWK